MSIHERQRSEANRRRSSRRWRHAGLVAMLMLLQIRSPALAQTVAGSRAMAGAETRWPAEISGAALGRPLTPEQQTILATTIFPDGQGLPPGRGLASEGARLYQQYCAACHGRQAQGATAPELIGGDGPLSRPDADKTLATYWPFATTLFDTLRRSMPPAAPGHLTADQLYALCAWLLAENRLWPAEQALDAAGLAGIRMPNRDGFIPLEGP
jgi:cytochrome c